MKRTSIYRRLTRRRRTLLGYSQLWLGPDHILLLKSSRFAEEYQRFALADIQALVITELPDRTLVQANGAVAALLWTLVLLAVSSIFAKVFFAVTGAIALAWVIADIARGARCRCHLYTAVSRELLAPVSRIRAARAFLDQLRPAIEAVQGTLPMESIAALAQPGGRAMIDRPPEVPHAPGYLPETLFALLLADAALIWLNLRFPQSDAGSVLFTTFFAEALLVVVALARRARDTRRFIYGLMIVAILCMGWDALGLAETFGSFWALAMESAKRGKPAPPFGFSWASSGTALFAAVWRLGAGSVGLAAAHLERRGAPK